MRCVAADFADTATQGNEKTCIDGRHQECVQKAWRGVPHHFIRLLRWLRSAGMSTPTLQQLAASALAAALSLAAARREADAAPRLEDALTRLSPLGVKQARRGVRSRVRMSQPIPVLRLRMHAVWAADASAPSCVPV
jgi:hypothetical protein